MNARDIVSALRSGERPALDKPIDSIELLNEGEHVGLAGQSTSSRMTTTVSSRPPIGVWSSR